MITFAYRCLVFLVLSLSSHALLAASAAPRAAIFTDTLPGHDKAFVQEVAAQVSGVGYDVEFIGITTLTNANELSTAKFDLLVLPGARSLPAVAAPAIENFLKQGGDLLALGLPAWESPRFELNGRWLSRADFERELNAQKPQQLLFDFAKNDLHQWSRATDESRNPVRHEITDADRGKALHVVIERFTGWETYQSPMLASSFSSSHTLTCFRAKGSPNTKQLALEWTERDGSRWIATVDLTTDWRDYALPPAAFKAWLPPPNRAGKEDHLRVENAARFVVGIAHSHTALEGSRHEYWIADIGTAPNPFGDAKLPDEFKPPHLESFSPGYQFHPISGLVTASLPNTVVRLLRAPAEGFARPANFNDAFTNAATGSWPAIHPRPRGVGFNQERAYRWEPLLAARDAGNGDFRGTLAALLIHVKPPFRGGVWAVVTPSEAAFYRQPLVTNCLRQTLKRMKRGIFLTEGGAEFFTVFPDQKFNIGAQVANFSSQIASNVSVVIELQDTYGRLKTHSGGSGFTLAPEEIVSERRAVQGLNADEERVELSLRQDGRVIDSISHEIGVWRPKSKAEFIEARDGGFWLLGKPWKAHGVNYMPSSGIGLANWRHFEHWVGRGAYDPEVIERDLRRIKAMNLNSVSVFIHHESLGAQHMLDFLRRCEVLGLKVNLSLRPGTPMDFRWNEMREMIETLRLAQNDTVFAYDLAWEPRHEARALQTDYAKLWPAWVEKRYDNVDAARKAWAIGEELKFEIPDFKSLPAPPMKWFNQDGPWRRLVADYRLFLDDLLRGKYAEARRLVKTIDPNHPVSFRMQHAGDCTFNSEGFLPYDFYGLADAVDIWEPEAYGRIGDWEKVKPGRFTADYARLCDPAKPVLWSEMGHSVWDNQNMEPAASKLEFQARYFSDFYRMLTDSGADGVFSWWYPGGYRLNEQSDFGIINPDGTDRPVTKVIREQEAKFLKANKTGTKPDYWMAVDRDRDSRGLFGIYEAVKEDYWHAIADGETPGLKWERKPGQANQPK